MRAPPAARPRPGGDPGEIRGRSGGDAGERPGEMRRGSGGGGGGGGGGARGGGEDTGRPYHLWSNRPGWLQMWLQMWLQRWLQMWLQMWYRCGTDVVTDVTVPSGPTDRGRSPWTSSAWPPTPREAGRPRRLRSHSPDATPQVMSQSKCQSARRPKSKVRAVLSQSARRRTWTPKEGTPKWIMAERSSSREGGGASAALPAKPAHKGRTWHVSSHKCD